MSLALLVLDGPQKGKELPLQKDYVFESSFYGDEEMGTKHAAIGIDQNFSWNINVLGKEMIRVGSKETDQVSLILGLVFHLGQTGFKVIEPKPLHFEDWEDAAKSWLTEQNWQAQQTDFFFFLYPVRLTFLQGPQADEFFTISYGPRVMGFNNMDLNIKDPQQPQKLVRFYQIGDTAYVENLAGDKVLVNKLQFDHHAIADGDRLTFGMNQVELAILK